MNAPVNPPFAFRGPFGRNTVEMATSVRTTPLDGVPGPIENEIPISQLPLAGLIDGSELVAIVQNGVTARTTAVALTQASKGPQGPQGVPGPQGVQGVQGVPGPTGSTGSTGLQGVPGSTGPQGVEGPVGPQGPTGQSAVIVGQFGASKTPAQLPTNGVIPANWDAAGVPPSQLTMQVGQALIYTVNNHIWVYVGTSMVPAGWSDMGSSSGPQGPTGPTGPQGTTGATGLQGPAGPTAISANAGNIATLGSDSLIYVASTPSTATPLMDSTAAVGTGTTWARADHVHPTDTSRYAASNPTGYQTAAQVTAAIAAQPVGDNRAINGNFAFNQRAYASGTALAAAAYGHDRWKAGAGGCSYTFSVVVPDTTITISAGTLTQIIEAGMIEGGVYTLSWTGTAQGRVYQGAPAGAYAVSPVTTASLTAGTNTVVEFSAGTVGRVKLEIGSVATLFNRKSLQQSLADCMRYYQGLDTFWGTVGGNPNFTEAQRPFPVVMRGAPTLLIKDMAGNAGRMSVYVIGTGQQDNIDPSLYGFFTPSSTVLHAALAFGSTIAWYRFQYTLSAEL